MGIATAQEVLGPWTQREEPLWASNGGHGMIFRTSSGDELLVFHHPNDSPHERARFVPVAVRGTATTVI